MSGVALAPDELLRLVPQQEPFRFLDEIVTVNDERIVAKYRFRPEADFYRGHFPGNPVTPGVILIESMAQAGVVALGIYLVAKDHGLAEVDRLVTMFTEAEIEFSGVVKPGATVTAIGERVFWKRRKLRSKVEMRLEDGTVVASGAVAGLGVPK